MREGGGDEISETKKKIIILFHCRRGTRRNRNEGAWGYEKSSVIFLTSIVSKKLTDCLCFGSKTVAEQWNVIPQSTYNVYPPLPGRAGIAAKTGRTSRTVRACTTTTTSFSYFFFFRFSCPIGRKVVNRRLVIFLFIYVLLLFFF